MNALQHRPIRLAAWVIRLIGFALLYLALHRIDALFGTGSMSLGFKPADSGYFASHLGGISIILIGVSYVLEFIEHSKEAEIRQRFIQG